MLCGIDEAGRGPLAGPVVACAVLIEDRPRIRYVKDSKQLTALEREDLFKKITDRAIEIRVSVVDHNVIDEINILKANMRAMENCLNSIENEYERAMIDGNYFKFEENRHNNFRYMTIVDGDQKIYQISCASIIAKVTRDNIMKQMHEEYPMYGFDTHKGYATKHHIEMIKKFGPCEIHRKSFCKNFLQGMLSFNDDLTAV